MLLPVTATCLIVAIVVARRIDGRRSGLLFGLRWWAAGVALAAVPVLGYRVRYSLQVDIFVSACLVALSIGYLLKRHPARTPPERPWREPLDRRLGALLAWTGIAGSLLLLASVVQSNVSLSLSFLLQNLDTIRDRSLSLATSGGTTSPFALVGTWLAPAGYLAIVLSTRLRIARVLVAANLALIVLVALFYYGGRQTIIVAIMLPLVGLWLRRVKIIRFNVRTGLAIAVIAVAGWYFVTQFSEQRQRDSNPAYLLRVTGRAEYRPWIERAANTNPTLGASLLQFSYFSSPIPSLMFYMESAEVPKPLLGQYSFPLPAQLLATILGTSEPAQWQAARRKVFRPFERAGFLGNAWATGLRDLVADFGSLGAIAFYGLLGVFLAWARNMFEATGGAMYHALETYGTVIFAFGAFQSLLYADYVAYGVYIAWGIVIVQSARRRPTGAARYRSGDDRVPHVSRDGTG